MRAARPLERAALGRHPCALVHILCCMGGRRSSGNKIHRALADYYTVYRHIKYNHYDFFLGS